MAEGSKLLERSDAIALARFLDEPREAFGTRVTIAERDKRRPPDRRAATRTCGTARCRCIRRSPSSPDERWAEICEQFIEQMGFAGETAKAQCRWVAIRHGRSAGGSDHAHLVVTLVAEDGSKAIVHNDRPRAQKACRELEQRFGLRRLEARTRRGRQPRAQARRARRRPPARAGSSASAASTPSARAGRRSSGSSAPARPPAATRASSSAGCATRGSAAAPATPRAAPTWSSATPSGSPAPARARGGACGTAAAGSPATSRSRRCGAAGAKTRRRSSARSPSGTRRRRRAPRSPAERQAELEQRALMWHRCTTELERVRQQLRAAGSRPRRDRARRPRRRRRPRRLVARARRRAARRARPRRPPARPLRRAARPHAAAAASRSRARPGWRCSCSPPASPTRRSAG